MKGQGDALFLRTLLYKSTKLMGYPRGKGPILFSVLCSRKQGRVEYIWVLLSKIGGLLKAGNVSKLAINLAVASTCYFLRVADD